MYVHFLTHITTGGGMCARYKLRMRSGVIRKTCCFFTGLFHGKPSQESSEGASADFFLRRAAEELQKQYGGNWKVGDGGEKGLVMLIKD